MLTKILTDENNQYKFDFTNCKIEAPIMDAKIRKQLRIKIGKQLPLNLKEDSIVREMLSKFEVLSIDEWKERFKEINIDEI